MSTHDLEQWVKDWYRALDEHADIEQLWPYLAEDDLTFTFPEGVYRGREEFRRWYDGVVRIFFDEQHTVTSVEGDDRTLKVVVNWQARIWNPPAPRSSWLGFDARQTWQVVTDDAGRPRIATYVVDGLDPMPGSASL
ncbi:nuclear transport factor 2 family protein [Nonomuraea sp. LPB2021202275-12-8]|uniref:nuclear transport factor 2 family protein n=1 Tax=Nonomuraea sp. LPB2021202275-12-8 TaxID=3120159 RepID=UPI00300D64D6